MHDEVLFLYRLLQYYCYFFCSSKTLYVSRDCLLFLRFMCYILFVSSLVLFCPGCVCVCVVCVLEGDSYSDRSQSQARIHLFNKCQWNTCLEPWRWGSLCFHYFKWMTNLSFFTCNILFISVLLISRLCFLFLPLPSLNFFLRLYYFVMNFITHQYKRAHFCTRLVKFRAKDPFSFSG